MEREKRWQVGKSEGKGENGNEINREKKMRNKR